MILKYKDIMVSIEEIKKIVFAEDPSWVIKAREESEKANMHFNGVGVLEYLEKLENFENKEQYAARKKLVTSTRFLFNNISRPIDNVFHANGGSKAYPQKNQKKIISLCDNIRHGYSIKNWCRNVQANRYYTDPNGLVLMEWNENTTYPVIKSIHGIKNYKSDGRSVEWVCFKPITENEKQYIRFIDDAFDYTFRIEKQTIVLIEEKTFKNPFGKCPAIVNSDILHFELDRKDSPFAPVFELADHYLRTGSVKNIYENYHGYPIFWAYGINCKKCFGSGEIIGEDEKPCPCDACGGSGTSLKKDVTDVIKLTPPADSQDPVIAPNVAGYVQPDLETWREQRIELKDLENMMNFTIWGSHRKSMSENETATAAFLDVQPVNSRLFLFSEAFEDIEQKITEFVCLYFNQSNEGVSINWGKRFQLESPDAIWQRYITAKKDGANKTTLDYLLKSFYQAEYANDNEMLISSMKLIRIEPFVHLTEKEVKDNGVSGVDMTAKIYFNEWISTLEDGYLYLTAYQKLKTEFDAFVLKKNEQQKPIEEAKEVIEEPKQVDEENID